MTSEELDEIKAHTENARLDGWGWAADYYDDVPALLAEVERLRAENEGYRANHVAGSALALRYVAISETLIENAELRLLLPRARRWAAAWKAAAKQHRRDEYRTAKHYQEVGVLWNAAEDEADALRAEITRAVADMRHFAHHGNKADALIRRLERLVTPNAK